MSNKKKGDNMKLLKPTAKQLLDVNFWECNRSYIDKDNGNIVTGIFGIKKNGGYITCNPHKEGETHFTLSQAKAFNTLVKGEIVVLNIKQYKGG